MSEQAHDHEHSLINPYAYVLAALFALTSVTVAIAYVDFGHPWSDIIALLIAVSKAGLVVAFFMHVKGSTRLIKLSVASGVFGVIIFFMIILTDYLGRGFS